MPYVILSRHGGRFHECVPQKDVYTNRDTSVLRELNDGEGYISVSWNGGWDEYLVKLDDVRDQTEAEMGIRYDPTCGEHGSYLRGQFCVGQNGTTMIKANQPFTMQKNQCIRITAHLAGGD